MNEIKKKEREREREKNIFRDRYSQREGRERHKHLQIHRSTAKEVDRDRSSTI